MHTALNSFCRVVSVVQILLMATMLVAINMLVVTRYFFSYSAPWTEELTNFSMVWMVMLGAGVLTLFDDHIALHMVVEKLSPRGRYWQKIISFLVIIGASGLIVYEGVPFVIGMYTVEATGTQISMLWPTLAIPVGGLIILVSAVLQFVNFIINGLGGRPIGLPEQAEFMDSTFKPAEEEHTEDPKSLHLNEEAS